MRLSARQIAGVAAVAGFTGKNLTIAIAVCLAESQGNTTAQHRNTNGSTDFGLWQINSIHGDILRQGTWSNPVDNGRMARVVFDNAGGRWTPWSTYKNGSYLAFMAVASSAAKRPEYISGAGSHPGIGGHLVTGTPAPGSTGGQGTSPGAQDFGGSTGGSSTQVIPVGSSSGGSLTSGHTWVRIAEFTTGLLLMLIAVAFLTKGSIPLPGIAGAIAKAKG